HNLLPVQSYETVCLKIITPQTFGMIRSERLTIAKALITHNYDRDRILSFLVFLKNFLYIENEEPDVIKIIGKYIATDYFNHQRLRPAI
ncbi:MAG: hypothetical protein QHC79_27740, partial [Pseudosphingobacterium sp.]|nr:hypothetical protein [Pseudosphingobacterium sp.]